MTKKLLIALLITGISVTTNAEPVVYFCKVQHHARITINGVSADRSGSFIMKFDLSRRTVDFTGDVLGGFKLSNVEIWENRVGFIKASDIGLFVFDHGYLSYAGLYTTTSDPLLLSNPKGLLSKCERA